MDLPVSRCFCVGRRFTGSGKLPKEKAAAGKILIAGTGAESTPETIEHTNRAASLGFDFALVRTPNYYKPAMSIEAEATHFLRVADAARIPILLYSVPVFTGYTIEAPLVARVAHHENIVGMKDSSGSVERVGEILAVAPERFRLLVGSASTLEPSLAKGACGAILALACAFPELCCEIYDSAQAGDIVRAQELQKLLAAPSAHPGCEIWHFGIEICARPARLFRRAGAGAVFASGRGWQAGD